MAFNPRKQQKGTIVSTGTFFKVIGLRSEIGETELIDLNGNRQFTQSEIEKILKPFYGKFYFGEDGKKFRTKLFSLVDKYEIYLQNFLVIEDGVYTYNTQSDDLKLSFNESGETFIYSGTEIDHFLKSI